MTRAFVFDLDGTLLGADGHLSPVTVEALEEARRAGALLAVATARPLRLAQAALGGRADLFDALIVSNGAATHEGPMARRTDESPLRPRHVRQVVERARQLWPTCGTGWERGDCFSHDPLFADIAAQRRIIRILDAPPSAAPTGTIHQLVIATPRPHGPSDLHALRSCLSRAATVTDSAGGVIEVSSRRADKADAMLRWARRQGVRRSRLTAFGDGLNDVRMLRAAGRSVAMGNAVPEVAAIAADRALPHDQDGVAVFLTSLLRRST